ncbi:MAG: hypothetical protein O3A82_11000 [Verrucomicrobia bacterium]|nr:hypothetical protein [Verrucomicrobiota bacterium]MDA1047444.1 hypothetical protein [Verrucomicrobiota bacterium]
MRATKWRGNPAGHFGIPHYDTDWIAASALAGLPRDDTFSFYCPCGEQSGKASLAHATPSLSLRATQWRGNPAGHFGIPHYDTDWIAASAIQAFLAMTRLM